LHGGDYPYWYKPLDKILRLRAYRSINNNNINNIQHGQGEQTRIEAISLGCSVEVLNHLTGCRSPVGAEEIKKAAFTNHLFRDDDDPRTRVCAYRSINSSTIQHGRGER
jgi:hypothetical protein